MNFNSLYYFTELAKDLNMTRTAERLYISQQNLSNHIARLEAYYGIPLFTRKPKLTLTYAGSILLSFAQHTIFENTNMLNIMNDINNETNGILRFGGSPIRINSALPIILPKFVKRFPNVKLEIHDLISNFMEEQIKNSNLDLALVLSTEANVSIESHHLMDDPIYLLVPDSLLQQYYPKTFKDIKLQSLSGATLSNFAKLPFCDLDNRMGLKIKQDFQKHNISPHFYTVSNLTQLSTNIAFHGTACAFTSHIGLSNFINQIPEDLNIFPILIDNKPFIQSVSLIHRKNLYLNSYMLFFMNLIQEYSANLTHIKLTRIATVDE